MSYYPVSVSSTAVPDAPETGWALAHHANDDINESKNHTGPSSRIYKRLKTGSDDGVKLCVIDWPIPPRSVYIYISRRPSVRSTLPRPNYIAVRGGGR